MARSSHPRILHTLTPFTVVLALEVEDCDERRKGC